jgi:hypothetical protein
LLHLHLKSYSGYTKKKTIIHSIKLDIYKCPFFSFAYQAFFRCKLNNKINIVLKEKHGMPPPGAQDVYREIVLPIPIPIQ